MKKMLAIESSKKTVRQHRAASAPRSHSLGGALCFERDNAGMRTAISSTRCDGRARDGCVELHDRQASRTRNRLGHICARPVTERVPIVFALRGEQVRWQCSEAVNKAFERVVSPSM